MPQVAAGEAQQSWLVLTWNKDIEANVLGGPYPLPEIATSVCQEIIDNGGRAAILGPISVTFIGPDE